MSDAQFELVATMEDRVLAKIPERVRPLFCSEGMRDIFTSLYGAHPQGTVLHNPALDIPRRRNPDPHMRVRLTNGHPGPVVGFLGGADPRKGGDDLVRSLASEPEVFLLAAGPKAEQLDARTLAGRYRCLGMLTGLDDFFASIDVLMVPSHFEPFGLVVTEAAARGVPTLARPGVGSLALLERFGAGRAWTPGQSIAAEVHRLRSTLARTREACARLTLELDPDDLGNDLARVWGA